jgi:hypothetical protein
VHAHAYALAIKNITGVAIEKMLPTPNINLDQIPECAKYLAEGSHRRLYTFSPDDYKDIAGIWSSDEKALAGDPPGELEVVDGMPDGGKIHTLGGVPSAFTPDYAPEELFEVAQKLYKKISLKVEEDRLTRVRGRYMRPRRCVNSHTQRRLTTLGTRLLARRFSGSCRR